MREIKGTARNDRLVATGAAEEIYGLAGDDAIFGGAGNDDIEGGTGNDALQGGAGDDELYGQAGDDILDGGTGDDELTGGAGRDVFVYGAGRDTIEDFRSGEDVIRLDPSLGVRSLSDIRSIAVSVDGGDDTLIRFSDSDTLLLEDVRLASLRTEFFDFGALPAAPPGPAPVAPQVTTQAGTTLTGDDRPNRIDGTQADDRIDGRGGNDDLDGGAGNDRITGGSGNDDLDGDAGNDVLRGGSGRDDLDGGPGNDLLDGGTGNDTLNGGAGFDRFVFSAGRDVVEDFRFGEDVVVVGARFGVADFDALIARAVPRDSGDDTLIRLDGGTMRLEDVRLASLSASDFDFV